MPTRSPTRSPTIFPTIDIRAQNCMMSEWQVASSCSRSCGGGVQQLTRFRLRKSAFGGNLCPLDDITSLKECNIEACPPKRPWCFKCAMIAEADDTLTPNDGESILPIVNSTY